MPSTVSVPLVRMREEDAVTDPLIVREAPSSWVIPVAGELLVLRPVMLDPELRMIFPVLSNRVGVEPSVDVVRNSPEELVAVPEPTIWRTPLLTSTSPLLLRSRKE